MCLPIKVEIVFITVTEDRVTVTTRCVHWSDPIPANTKVNRVLPARKPAAVTHIPNLKLFYNPNIRKKIARSDVHDKKLGCDGSVNINGLNNGSDRL